MNGHYVKIITTSDRHAVALCECGASSTRVESVADAQEWRNTHINTMYREREEQANKEN